MIETLACVLLIGLVAAVARVTERSWIAPAAFFSLLWAGYAASAAFFVIDLDGYAPALLWIAFACGAVQLGAFASHRWLPPVVGQCRSVTLSEASFAFIKPLTGFLILVGMAEVVFILSRANYSVSSLFSFAVVSQLSAENRSAFGYGELNQGIIERIAYVLIYTGPLFGGVLLRVSSTLSGKVLSIMSLVMVTTVSVFYGSRMGVLFGGSFWIAAYMSSHVLIGASTGKVDDRILVRVGVIGVVVLFGLSLFAMITRYSASESHPLFLLIADPFTFIAAFAIWFEGHGLYLQDFLMGYRTFLRILQIFGLGIEWAPAIDVGFSSSNIFTVFRGLIEDFGTVGALVWLFGFGVIGGIAYQRVLEGVRGFLPILVFVFSFSFVSVAFSVFSYAAPIAALVLFSAYFILLRRVEVAAVVVDRPAEHTR